MASHHFISDITRGYGQVITSQGENEQISYVYGLGRLSASENIGNDTLKTTYVHDGHGSVVQTVAGEKAQSYSYTPYGEMLGEKQTGFGYSGEWYDAKTGMQNLRARQYEPAMARFSQMDLVRGTEMRPTTLNRYPYTHNDPINLIDPNGLYPVDAEGNRESDGNLIWIDELGDNVWNGSEWVPKKVSSGYPEGSKEAAKSAQEVAAASKMGYEAAKDQYGHNPQVQAAIKRAEEMYALYGGNIDEIFAQQCAVVTNNYEDYIIYQKEQGNPMIVDVWGQVTTVYYTPYYSANTTSSVFYPEDGTYLPRKDNYEKEDHPKYVITVPKDSNKTVRLRYGPSTDNNISKIINNFRDGTELEVIGTVIMDDGMWYFVNEKNTGKYAGFVHEDYVEVDLSYAP